MNESSQRDQSAISDDARDAPDALVLEGLSGLEEMMVNPMEQSPSKSPHGTVDLASTSSSAPASASVQPTVGFRSARELRAAQERSAAQQRSAMRRRDGITQALGIPQAVEIRQPTASPVARPKAPVSGPIVTNPLSFTPAPMAAPQEKTPPLKREAPEQQRPSPNSPDTKPLAPAREVVETPQQPLRKPLNSGSSTDEKLPPHFRRQAPPQDRQTSLLKPSPPPEPQQRTAARSPEARLIAPSMETSVRNRRTTSSFLPGILMALLLTSLVWGSLIYAFWQVSGKEWAAGLVQQETETLRAGLSDRIRTLDNELRFLKEEVSADRANNEKFKRISALEAGIYADNSRQRFDDIIDIGRTLETGSAEEEFYSRTKERVEIAYTKRLGQHKGLHVARLFPKLDDTKEANLSKTTLMTFIDKPEASGWDRSRAAYLLRRFEDDDQVVAHLRQTIRDDDDLQVVFACWETLLALTDYDPGSTGFSPPDFDRWWSKRISG